MTFPDRGIRTLSSNSKNLLRQRGPLERTAPLTFRLIALSASILNGCTNEVPKLTLPAPEYERPTSIPWPGETDAGMRLGDIGGHEKSLEPIELETESDTSEQASTENTEPSSARPIR